MAFYNNRSLALERGAKRGPRGASGLRGAAGPRGASGPRWSFGPRRPFGPVGHRLAAVLRPTEDPDAQATGIIPIDPETLVAPEPQRFSLTFRGYDRIAVDEYLSQLEGEIAVLDRELGELRGGGVASREVASEIKRIGEQTSAVLLAAHEQREEILHRARAEADRCVTEARATAAAITEQSRRRLRELSAQTESAQGERDRLLDELRAISDGLVTVADSAKQRAAVS